MQSAPDICAVNSEVLRCIRHSDKKATVKVAFILEKLSYI